MSVPVCRPVRSSVRRIRRITAASPSPAKLSDFLRHLEESGSVSVAARRSGIGRNTVYTRRKLDPEFALAWEKALVMAVEGLRDRAIALARDGTERTLWWRGRRVATVREYDTRLLIFLLRLLKPEVFGAPGRARASGGTGRTVPNNSGQLRTTRYIPCPSSRA